MDPTYVTVEEANAFLPRARAALRRVRAGAAAARRRADRLAVLGLLWGAPVRDPSHADHGEYRRHARALARLRRRMERTVARRLGAHGVRFPPGGIEHGLLDFPTVLDDRPIYLCWQMDEPEVGFWHERQAGFPGRRPITAAEAKRIGKSPA
jgi:hypothetical protein